MLDNLTDIANDSRKREITINIISLTNLQGERIEHISNSLLNVMDKVISAGDADNKSEKEQVKQ